MDGGVSGCIPSDWIEVIAVAVVYISLSLSLSLLRVVYMVRDDVDDSFCRCKPKKCRQECKKSCPVVKIGKLCVEVSPTSKLAWISEQLCIGYVVVMYDVSSSGWIAVRSTGAV